MNTLEKTPRIRKKGILRLSNITGAVALGIQACMPQTGNAHEETSLSVEQIRAYNEQCEALHEESRGRKNCNDYFVAEKVLQTVTRPGYKQLKDTLDGYAPKTLAFPEE